MLTGGRYSSFTQREYILNGESKKFMLWETVEFQECNPLPIISRVNHKEYSATYDANGNILRYHVTSEIQISMANIPFHYCTVFINSVKKYILGFLSYYSVTYIHSLGAKIVFRYQFSLSNERPPADLDQTHPTIISIPWLAI